MARHHTTARAFEMLVAASQQTNLKLVHVARWLIAEHEHSPGTHHRPLGRRLVRGVPRCVLAAFFNCLSDFFCRLKAVRRLSSRRATARSTFCAAATLAVGGVCADVLRLAAGLLEF
jgi:hypothetical protein